MEEKRTSRSVLEKKNAAVQINICGGGLGAAILIGGVLATTALTSAFFARKKARSEEDGSRSPSPEICNKAKNQEELVILDGPSTDSSEDSSGSDKGVSPDKDTGLMVSPQSSLLDKKPGIEIDGDKLENAHSQPNDQLVCGMKKIENGEPEGSTEEINSHEDSIMDEKLETENYRDMPNGDVQCSIEKVQSPKKHEFVKDEVPLPRTETDGDTLVNASSQPKTQFICVMSVSENGDAECSIESIQSLEEVSIAHQVVGTETDAASTFREFSTQPNEQSLCAMKKAENCDAVCSIENIQPREHVLNEKKIGVEAIGGTHSEDPSQQNETFIWEYVVAECSIEKIQSPGDDLMVLKDEVSDSGTDAAVDEQFISVIRKIEDDEAVSSTERMESHGDTILIENPENEVTQGMLSDGLMIQDQMSETETSAQGDDFSNLNGQNVSVMRPCEDCGSEKVQTSKLNEKAAVEAKQDMRDNAQNKSTSELISSSTERHESKRLNEETKGKLNNDTLAKNSSFSATSKLANHHSLKDYTKFLVAINPTKRRILMVLLSVLSSLVFSNLLDLSLVKLCLIGFLSVVLFEIHGL